MLLMEELRGVSGIELLLLLFFFCSGVMCADITPTRGAGSRQMEGSPGQQGARAQELRPGRDF